VAELILRCKKTKGVVERRVELDAELVQVSRRFARHLTHTLKIYSMGLTEVPSELLRMKNVKELFLRQQQPMLAAE
jgi:hypothetical protein